MAFFSLLSFCRAGMPERSNGADSRHVECKSVAEQCDEGINFVSHLLA